MSEAAKVAESIRLMGVRHAVITSVDRDDLPDGGVQIWAITIRKIREVNPGITMEILRFPIFQEKSDLPGYYEIGSEVSASGIATNLGNSLRCLDSLEVRRHLDVTHMTSKFGGFTNDYQDNWH